MKDLKKYKRFFAFGCSMTAYWWPTWADIIAKEIPESYNFGQSGGGNLFISCQVAEANLKYKFNKDDLVMVMWSGVSREDRYVDKHWLTPGNIYTQGYYDAKFVDKFVDPRGQLIRDLSLITMCKGMLDSLDVTYHMLNMAPFVHLQSAKDKNISDVYEVLKQFSSTTAAINTDIYTLELDCQWPQHPISIPGGQTADYHPSPRQHFGYINKLFPEIEWSDTTRKFVAEQESIVMKARTFDDLPFRPVIPARL